MEYPLFTHTDTHTHIHIHIHMHRDRLGTFSVSFVLLWGYNGVVYKGEME